jgi:hypothetical protein
VCTWCNGMVWSAKDIKDMEDMEVLGTLEQALGTLEGLAVSTGATTAGEEEGIDTSLAFSL